MIYGGMMNRTTRWLTNALAATGVTAGFVLGSAGPAAAAGCTVVCGGVTNDSAYVMQYTRALNASTQPNWCDVWNKNGGNSWSWAHWKCYQRDLGTGGSAGGVGSRFDVDAFSFNSSGYYVRFRNGSWRWLDRGVWTKIRDYEEAWCKQDNGIRCTVTPH
jgi:hypothetical protein